ncbi:flagellar protein FlaG [Brevibacillus humidisoli]|uniref:flagellar protein FlaG n=1 Tax=Brevibacillus humidisoli TaxID=2895522 RepID=UPI001E33247E|nr:flagellar protein FlaG [Brevibacillus humidisoli]UFJ40046.1 flagellar protein FlaG [Brevibacillus humidisoli]
MRIEANGSATGVSTQYSDKAASGSIQTENQGIQERSGDESLERKPNRPDLEKELENLNKWAQSRGTHIKFTLHDKLNEYYIQVVNNETNEVVREIPSKKIMDISAKLQEMIGLLFDERR